MKDDDILIVASDHGNSRNGEHINSREEDQQNATIFIFGKNILFPIPNNNIIHHVDIYVLLCQLFRLPLISTNIGILKEDLLFQYKEEKNQNLRIFNDLKTNID